MSGIDASFVKVGDDIGKLIDLNDDKATVEFFDVPVPGGTHVVAVPRVSVTRVLLERQTRIWWQQDAQWRIGRVLEPPDQNAETYLIALSSRQNVELPPDQFFVRWSRPIEDPVRLLEARVADIRFIQSSRSAFRREVLRHRAAAEGLIGITSSGVRLHQHQVTAARRVLLDPVRRYLLADEVGLGKTIEAGMVLRQTLLEQAGSRGLVLAPEALIPQWETELAEKFDVQGLRGGWVDVQPYESVLTDRSPAPISILVVDEAHRLAGGEIDSGIYEAVEGIAATAPHLLLLSATPVRSNEERFLRLLHLLDPDIYPLDGIQAFRERIEQRDQIGNALALLGGDTPTFLLNEPIDLLAEAFPEDIHLARMLDQLRQDIAEHDEIGATGRSQAVKNYVSDTYRLHRRLIRTRRNDRLQQVFPVRRRVHGEPFRLIDSDARRGQIVESLDRFRVRLSSETNLDRAEILRVVAERCSAATPAVRALKEALLSGDSSDLLDWERPSITTLGMHPLGNDLAAWIGEALSHSAPDDRFEVMADWAWSRVNKKKVAACSSFTSVGRAAYERMGEKYGKARVAGLLSDMSPEELEVQYQRAFKDETCLLLVIDNIAEEGWNLQFVTDVLHLDLPWSANRLEQRLGRFDRFALGLLQNDPVASTVVTDSAPLERLTGAWTRLLDEGFNIFRMSSATLQYVLPDVETEAVQCILEEGFGSLADHAAEIHERLGAIRRNVEGQDILDSVEDNEEDQRYFEELKRVDQDSRALGDATSNWVGKALNFSESYSKGTFKFGIQKKNPPLITESEIRRMGLDIFDRRYAVRRTDCGKGGSVPLRPGQQLVDSAFAFGDSDGRGRSFAGVLEVNGAASPFPVFYFDFLVEAFVPEDQLDDRFSRNSLELQAARHLPPQMFGVWCVPGRGEPPPAVKELLSRQRAESLAEDVQRFGDLTEGMSWGPTCRKSENEARDIVLANSDYADSVSRALRSLLEEQSRLEARSLARSRVLGEKFDSEELAERFRVLREAVSCPRLRTDSCGVVLLAPPG